MGQLTILFTFFYIGSDEPPVVYLLRASHLTSIEKATQSHRPGWLMGIPLIYPRGSNSEHKPGAQNEHQPNAENKGLIWWYDTDKFLYQNQKKDQVDTMNM